MSELMFSSLTGSEADSKLESWYGDESQEFWNFCHKRSFSKPKLCAKFGSLSVIFEKLAFKNCKT